MEEIRVLLVDDEEDFRRAITRRLSKRGMLIEQAGTGEECTSILEKWPVDVVVLDVKMPGMSGIEVLKRIKEKYTGTEVILLTGHASVRDGVEGIKSGAFDYVTKPLELEHLVCKIQQAHARTRQEAEKRGEAESMYQALLQSVTDYVIAINNNCQILMANNLFRNEFGMHQDGFCYKAWKNRDEKCEDCLVEKSFRDGQSRKSEETVVMKDGRSAQMLVKSTPVMNESGKIAYVLATATDITVKKRLAEELNKVSGDLEGILNERLRELEKSEERYRTIFERSPDAIIHTDPKGGIMEINQAGLRILEHKTSDDLFSFGPAMDLFENREDLYLFQKMLFREGFVTEFETRLKGKKKRSFDAVITSSVIFDIIGQITGYVMIIRDVTKRKSAQEQVKRQNVRLATLNAISLTVSSSLALKEVLHSTIDEMLKIPGPDCVRIYLLDDKKEILNLAANKGFSPGFIKKTHMRSRRVGDGLLGKTVLTRETAVVDNVLRSEDPYVDSIAKEGIKATVYIPLVLKKEPVGVMCVCSRSELKFSEDYVEFFTAVGNQIGMAVGNAVLYEGANRAYKELKEVQEQVIRSEKLASLGKLSATIAHEINNPLSAVLTYIRLLMKLKDRDLLAPKRMEDISRYLTTMESETARCGEIVKNLLAFSRQSKMTIEEHNIEDIINKTLILISHDLEMKEIRLVKEIEPDLPKVKCDFKQIQQALLNLVSNASEAMTKGGILSLTASCPGDDGFLDVLISDTGCGIPQKDLKNIFEPFFTTKEEGKGVGLGLSVVYGIITRHNGSIDVESEPGKGSSFKVRLPTAQ
ncbi:MAG: PAS domain S-box protein [Deltaproteobacteria bacterium]|nr:PAS domain S-box protein [Deltaproteobacteria bacterium]MBW2116768.1 PAS domain S-box protein [Deltaproteobacteria bacterium]MBW2343553.1 PAS domain S-box protein [Deltaproteobacteria bacterium]